MTSLSEAQCPLGLDLTGQSPAKHQVGQGRAGQGGLPPALLPPPPPQHTGQQYLNGVQGVPGRHQAHPPKPSGQEVLGGADSGHDSMGRAATHSTRLRRCSADRPAHHCCHLGRRCLLLLILLFSYLLFRFVSLLRFSTLLYSSLLHTIIIIIININSSSTTNIKMSRKTKEKKEN